MTQITDYERGFRDALRTAATALHARADEMVEPHARGFWNSAAFLVGCLIRNRKRGQLSATAAGYQIVPVEPTEAMVEVLREWPGSYVHGPLGCARAMLKAAKE